MQAHNTITLPKIKICAALVSSLSFFFFDSDAFDFEYGTVLLRMNEGLDVSHIVEAEGMYVV